MPLPPLDPILEARIALTRRPDGQPVVMRQEWTDLLFLHWPIDPALIQQLLPPGLTVDTFEGNAYVGLVPFAMRGVRPVWSPSVPGLSTFLEVNVRTYVHRNGAEPGVWFFSLDAANPVAVHLARRLWRLPYYWARMALHRESSGAISYVSQRRGSDPIIGCQVEYHLSNESPQAAEPGTLLYFLAERYLLYAWNHQRLWSGRVWHTTYPLQGARLTHLEDTLVRAAGIALPPPNAAAALPLVHYASGVKVRIFPLRPVAERAATTESAISPLPAAGPAPEPESASDT